MAYTYETRNVTHGDQKAWFAKVIQDPETGEITYGDALEFTGVRAVTAEFKEDVSDFYADDQVHISLRGVKTCDGSIVTYQLRKQFLVDHLGKATTTAGALLDTGDHANFVFGYMETVTDAFGGNTPEWRILTNVQASAPTGGSVTDENQIKPKELTVPITAKPNQAVLDSKNRPVTEITWRDVDGDATALIELMFGDSPEATVQDVIDVALGNADITDFLSA